MIVHVQVNRTTRLIVAVGYFPDGSPDPNIEIIELTPEQVTAFGQPGAKRLEIDGTITVTPPEPPAVIYSGEQTMTNRITTTGTAPETLFRATLRLLTVYTAIVELIGIDAGNGATRFIRATMVAKRLNAGALLVGAPVVLANHADAAAATWTIAPSVVGNDLLIVVTGAAGRSVQWFFRIDVRSFTPGGQQP